MVLVRACEGCLDINIAHMLDSTSMISGERTFQVDIMLFLGSAFLLFLSTAKEMSNRGQLCHTTTYYPAWYVAYWNATYGLLTLDKFKVKRALSFLVYLHFGLVDAPNVQVEYWSTVLCTSRITYWVWLWIPPTPNNPLFPFLVVPVPLFI